MPTYQYACTDCSQQLEVHQSFTDDALTECPACEGRLRKIFNAVGVVFKGSGFYKTDSRSTSQSAQSSESAESTPAKESNKSGSGDDSGSSTSSKEGSSSSEASGSKDSSKSGESAKTSAA